MGRVKDGVDKLKSALQVQRGELVRRMEEISAETAVRALTSSTSSVCIAKGPPGKELTRSLSALGPHTHMYTHSA